MIDQPGPTLDDLAEVNKVVAEMRQRLDYTLDIDVRDPEADGTVEIILCLPIGSGHYAAHRFPYHLLLKPNFFSHRLPMTLATLATNAAKLWIEPMMDAASKEPQADIFNAGD